MTNYYKFYINGKIYNTVKEVSKKFGINLKTLYSAIEYNLKKDKFKFICKDVEIKIVSAKFTDKIKTEIEENKKILNKLGVK